MTKTKQCAAEAPAEVELLKTVTTFAVVGEGAVIALGHLGIGGAWSIKCCVPLPGSRSGIWFSELAADLGPTPSQGNRSIAPSARGVFGNRTADNSGEHQRACE